MKPPPPPITHEQYLDIMNAHVQAGMQMAQSGHLQEAMKLMSSILRVAWEVTRPGVEMHTLDITASVPEYLKSTVKHISVSIVINADGKPLMGYGKGSNHEGASLRDGAQLTDAQAAVLSKLCDEQIAEHFGYLDMSGVTKIDDIMVGLTEDRIDKEVVEFNTELDSLFQTWRGGDEK